jgi:diphosphomevalonate decarboxylase
MSAIALSLCDIERRYFSTFSSDNEFFKKASYVARLGSGSACRSLYGGIVSWGKIAGVHNSSDIFGSKFSVNTDSVFSSYHDSILIVNSGEKKVSSSVGHNLMNLNPFSHVRFEQAKANINNLIKAIEIGDIEMFIKIVEAEALTLHAMMMTSTPYFLLLKPDTISIIDKIIGYRKNTGVGVCFTLDAGPNIHLLYPDKYKSEVQEFINSELLPYTINNTVIHDKVGSGPTRLEL